MWQVQVLPLLAICVFQSFSYPIGERKSGERTAFICKSHLDPITSIEEHALAPDSGLSTRSFLMIEENRWPRGVVPYEMDPTFTEKQVAVIKAAMKMMSDNSCVLWVRRYKQKDFVKFNHVNKKDKCNSAVGRKGGMQLLNLGDNCFDIDSGYQGAILHEMMHSIGFIHEQQRIDRDCFVGVAEKAAAQMKIDYGITPNTNMDFPYDYGSIMHYGNSQFMRSHNGARLGNFEGTLTVLDKMKLNNMYCRGPTYCEKDPVNCARFIAIQKKCEVKAI